MTRINRSEEWALQGLKEGQRVVRRELPVTQRRRISPVSILFAAVIAAVILKTLTVLL